MCINLMINALVSLPGDAYVIYPNEVSDFTIYLTNNGVSVLDVGENADQKKVSYLYLPDSFTAEGSISGKVMLCLEKKAKKIILRGCESG